MTNNQIADKLWDCGFHIRYHANGVLASLATRKVSVMEIQEVFDFVISPMVFERWGDKVMVRGINSQ